jgi:hypothetical protein
MVSTTTPLERSDSRVHRAGIFFFVPLLSGVIVKFHFKAVVIQIGKEMNPPEPDAGTRLLQISRLQSRMAG